MVFVAVPGELKMGEAGTEILGETAQEEEQEQFGMSVGLFAVDSVVLAV